MEAKHKENLARTLLSSQETILAMAANPPTLPEINKSLSTEEIQEVEQSPVYHTYSSQVAESRKLYAQAEVYYSQASEVENQITQTESEIARLNEEISQTSDEEIRKEKQTQIEIKQQELQKLSQQKDSLKTLADNTQKQAEEKERQAIDYLFAQEKNVYENILAYENLKEKGEIPAETAALAEETTGTQEEISMASVNLEEFSIESEVIDKVPEKVEKEIFIKSPEPKPVYTRERPIPIVNKLPVM
jgi:TolA-binding protein